MFYIFLPFKNNFYLIHHTTVYVIVLFVSSSLLHLGYKTLVVIEGVTLRGASALQYNEWKCDGRQTCKSTSEVLPLLEADSSLPCGGDSCVKTMKRSSLIGSKFLSKVSTGNLISLTLLKLSHSSLLVVAFYLPPSSPLPHPPSLRDVSRVAQGRCQLFFP